MVIWIIGLSGSGKTTIGSEVYQQWKQTHPDTVFIDGDEIRRIFKHDQSADCYTIDARRTNAERITEICRWLDGQRINQVCCLLSLFPEHQARNRELFSKYFEIYIDTPMEKLAQRDVKNLYSPAQRGEISNVVGMDIPFTPPPNPDMTIDNREDGIDVKSVARKILTRAGVI